jgi:hypothetical protein
VAANLAIVTLGNVIDGDGVTATYRACYLQPRNG